MRVTDLSKSRFAIKQIGSYWPETTIVVVATLIFFPSFSYPFLEAWDDHLYVTGHLERLQFSRDNILRWFYTPVVSTYAPLTMVSYMIDYFFWGGNAVGYRLQNLFWHITASIGIYRCLLMTAINRYMALFLVCMFVIHPQRVESVVWISERKDVLSAALFFWALFFYLRGRQSGTHYIAIAFCFFCSALLSKSMALSFPLVVLLYEYHRRELSLAVFKRLWPFVLLSLTWIPITLWSQQKSIQTDLNLYRQVGVVAHNFIWYVRSTILPLEVNPIFSRLHFSLRDIGAVTVVYLILSVLGGFAFWKNRRYFKYNVLPLAGSFIATLLPVVGIIPIGAIDRADRYSYIPSAFLLAMVGAGINAFWRRHASPVEMEDQVRISPFAGISPRKRRTRLLAVAGFLYLFALAAFTRHYVKAWSSLYSLMTWAYETVHPHPVVIGTLADLELQNARYDRVLRLAKELFDAAGNEDSDQRRPAIILKARYLRAAAFCRLREYRSGADEFQEILPHLHATSLRTAFDFDSIYSMAGECYREIGKYDQAIFCYTKLLEHRPTDFDARINRGVTYYRLGDYRNAKKDFRIALEIRPDNEVADHNLKQARQALAAPGG